MFRDIKVRQITCQVRDLQVSKQPLMLGGDVNSTKLIPTCLMENVLETSKVGCGRPDV